MPGSGYYDVKRHSWAEDRQLGALVTLGLYATFAWRVWLLPHPPAPVAGLLAYCLACAALVAWRHSPSWRAAYVRWREPLAALLRAAGAGCGTWAALTGRMMDTWPPVASTAAYLVLLLFASGGPSCLHHALAWKMRLWLSVLAQVAVLASIMPHHASYCAAPALSTPQARHAIHVAYTVLSRLSFILPLPLAVFVHVNPPAECVTLLCWLLLAVGGLLPLLWEARLEAAAWQRHQQHRVNAGLERERGASAAVLDAVWWAVGDEGMSLTAVAAVVMALAWDLCVIFSSPEGERWAEGPPARPPPAL